VENDPVRKPSHYNQGKIEVIEFIEDKKLGYHLGNATKYICRAGKKNPEKYVEDLKKAIWYLERAIELTKTEPRRPNDMNRWITPSICTNAEGAE
jgi:hypothetical protein